MIPADEILAEGFVEWMRLGGAMAHKGKWAIFFIGEGKTSGGNLYTTIELLAIYLNEIKK